MSIIEREKLVAKIYDRFGSAISKMDLYDAVQVICENLSDGIIDNEFISIENFGTFYKYKYDSRKTVDIHSKKLRKTKSFINIEFIPCKVFRSMIGNKKDFFNQSG